jgi:hypothetical protein
LKKIYLEKQNKTNRRRKNSKIKKQKNERKNQNYGPNVNNKTNLADVLYCYNPINQLKVIKIWISVKFLFRTYWISNVDYTLKDWDEKRKPKQVVKPAKKLGLYTLILKGYVLVQFI